MTNLDKLSERYQSAEKVTDSILEKIRLTRLTLAILVLSWVLWFVLGYWMG